MAATTTQYSYNPDDPSCYRRKALLAEIGDDGGEGGGSGGIAVSSFFPIQRYYEASEKVLAAFEEAYGQQEWDSAFVYGKRYCIFCIESIPKHNYYLSAKYFEQRRESTKNAEVVMKCLEGIKAKMDVEEREKYQKRMERIKAEQKRQEQLQKQREAAKYQELMKRAELQKQNNKVPTSPTNAGSVEDSVKLKLQAMMRQSSTSSVQSGAPVPPSQKRPSGRYFLSDTEDEDEPEPRNGVKLEVGRPLPPAMPPPTNGEAHHSSNGSLPPAMAPPSADDTPPSYDFAVNTNRRNPFLGPSNGSYAVPPPVQPWSVSAPPAYNSLPGAPDPPTKRFPTQRQQQQQQIAKKKKKIPVRQLRENARRQYHQLQSENRIEVRAVDTYQGRYSQSTNGCTVISPLVVARHLETSSGCVLNSVDIKKVIDNQCGPLLREIRGKLGLENHSLIIPSDVHDHLVDKHILKQEYFVGATGGNIIGEEHMGEFIKLFQEKRKAGAALFFREHVVSIIKIPVGANKAYYDLVDSMPGTKDSRNNPCATRTRCTDEEALDVLLAWYATKKFSESNCSYIDKNDWNDTMADLDPRVFQAFVWGKDE